MNPNDQPKHQRPEASETTTRRSAGSAASKRRPNPRITREAQAEVLLLQSLALRIGQEVAYQNEIKTNPYLALEGDPRGAHLANLEGITTETVTLRATLSVEINTRTGAIVGFTPPPRPRR